MASYFDVTSDADKRLLPPNIRSHQELANAAALVEADVIGYYTQDPAYFLYTNQLGLQGFFDATFGTGEDITAGQPTSAFPGAPVASAVVPQIRVFLRGYKIDANDPATDPNLRLALKRTIAEVIAWRINQWISVEAGVQSSSGTEGNSPRSKTFRPTAEDMYPPDWTRWLYPYDSRPPFYGW